MCLILKHLLFLFFIWQAELKQSKWGRGGDMEVFLYLSLTNSFLAWLHCPERHKDEARNLELHLGLPQGLQFTQGLKISPLFPRHISREVDHQKWASGFKDLIRDDMRCQHHMLWLNSVCQHCDLVLKKKKNAILIFIVTAENVNSLLGFKGIQLTSCFYC